MTIRRTITFTGRVQGVGFRATTRNIAGAFAVTGFVRNQIDGSVLCVVEGERSEVARFESAVHAAMAGCIDHADAQDSPVTGEFVGFEIRFGR